MKNSRSRGGARLAPVLLLIGLALGLSGCAIFKKTVLVCAPAAVVAGTGTLTHFSDGPGRDTGDVQYRAEISNLAVTCRKRSGGLETTITFELSAYSGPADTTGSAEIPFFVAVTLGSEEVLSKRIFSSEHYFPVQSGYSAYREEVVEFLPVFEGREVKEYEILVGFQLSPEQLEYNVMH